MNQDDFLDLIITEGELARRDPTRAARIAFQAKTRFEVFVLDDIDKIFAVDIGGDYSIVDSYAKLWEMYQDVC